MAWKERKLKRQVFGNDVSRLCIYDLKMVYYNDLLDMMYEETAHKLL